MRILIIHNFYQHQGGEDVVVQQEMDELRKKNHTVELLTVKNTKGLQGIKQFLLYPFNFLIANALIKEVNNFQPEIIHIHNLHYGLGPLLLRKLKKKGYPLVMTLHNFRLICPSATLFFNDQLFTASLREDFPWTAVKNKVLDRSFLKTFITAFTYWWHKKQGTWTAIDRYFVLSEFAKQTFLKSTLNVPAHKFTIKANAVNMDSSPEQNFGNDFIYIGRLSHEKGIIQLLEAISGTKHQLKIFGSGPLEEDVKKYNDRHDNIQYLGFQSHEVLQQEILKASALVVPSICYEGMPMTIIESFALGTPVLSSHIGILEQMIVPLYTGLHFDPYNKQSICDTFDNWLQLDDETKQKISQNCKNTFVENYTMDKNMHILESTYMDLIKKK